MTGERDTGPMGYLAFGVLIACLLCAAALSAGCGEKGPGTADGERVGADAARTSIPLSTLSQGVNSEYGRFDEMPIPEDAAPECLVITDKEDYQRLLSVALFQEAAPEVDFEGNIVIAVMQGPKNTGGYAVSITHMHQAGTAVRVEVEVVEPEPGSMTVQVLTSPYHLVAARIEDFEPRGELEFSFVDQNDNSLSRQPVEL